MYTHYTHTSRTREEGQKRLNFGHFWSFLVIFGHFWQDWWTAVDSSGQVGGQKYA
jgi:hypothetical protein